MSDAAGLWENSATAPHEALAALREADPVCRVTMPGDVQAWLVTRFEDVQSALTDQRLSNRLPWSAVGLDANLPPEIVRAVSQTMQALDPPDHTRLRRLVSGVFTARRVAALRPRIEEIADELVDRLAEADQADLVDGFASPLPMQVMCELLGVPPADRESFREWSHAAISGAVNPEGFAPAVISLYGYVQELLAAKRAEPGDDLLTALISARDDGDELSDDELTSMVFLLLIAGHETTVNLIGNGALVLLAEPERWRRLVSEPDLVANAVEEVLRLESPGQALIRFAAEPLELGGRHVEAGSLVLISLLSANRDESRFARPELFDPDRPSNAHLAFGRGIHFCLGAPLARLEGEIAFSALLKAFPEMRLAVPADEVTWRPGLSFRGLACLPVRLR